MHQRGVSIQVVHACRYTCSQRAMARLGLAWRSRSGTGWDPGQYAGTVVGTYPTHESIIVVQVASAFRQMAKVLTVVEQVDYAPLIRAEHQRHKSIV